MQDKYVKVVYQTPPLGESKIILYLTTFDLEAYKRDQLVEKTEKVALGYYRKDFSSNEAIEYLENTLNDYVQKYYGHYFDELRQAALSKKMLEISMTLDNVENVTNSGDVHCNIVKGNVVNCDNIYCNEIKGNVVNCDKIVYKNKEEKCK